MYFNSNPTGASTEQALQAAMAWARAQAFSTVAVRGALTHLWGCARPSCSSNAALVDGWGALHSGMLYVTARDLCTVYTPR